MNKNSVERELLFMYVVDYCGFHNVGFNFDLNKRYQIDSYVENEKVIRQLKTRYDGLQKPQKLYWNNARFFGENISALTMLIGENGAGKTTFMRLLILWLSLLAAGEEPKEPGLLLFRERTVEEDNLFYICFGGLLVKTDLTQEKRGSVDRVRTFLQKVSLVYHTDTMTDCGTGQIGNEEADKYLKDWSLLQRLANKRSWFIPKANASVAMNKTQLRRSDFQSQIDLFLSIDAEQRSKFPLHMLKFQYQKRNITGHIVSRSGETWMEKIWSEWRNYQWDKNGIPALLVCDIIYGYISYLFMMKEAYGQNWLKIKGMLDDATPLLKRSLFSMDSLKNESVFYFISIAEGIINNVSQLIKCECQDRWPELGDLSEIAIDAFSAIKAATNTSFFEKFVASEDQCSSEEKIWIMDIVKFSAPEQEQANINTIRRFFLACDRADSLKQTCWFEWQYPSSGGKNFVNLQTVIQTEKINAVSENGKQNGKSIWFLFDEPDNTFHSRWKRIVIQTILDMCVSNNTYIQLWISTHSPILLSDVPKQAEILLKREGTNKEVCYSSHSPFAQQIYRMFQDVFFMEDGAIGSFAEKKVDEALKEKKDKLLQILDILDEPLLKGYLRMVLRDGE